MLVAIVRELQPRVVLHSIALGAQERRAARTRQKNIDLEPRMNPFAIL